MFLVATPLRVQILWGNLPPKMALFIVMFCSRLRENAETENSQFGQETIARKVPRFGVVLGSNFMGEFTPKLRI